VSTDQRERIERYRTGAMTPAEREAFERELRANAKLRAALEQAGGGAGGAKHAGRVLDATRALEVAREFREEPGSLVRAAVPIAIAIVIGAVVWWMTPSRNAPTLEEGEAPSVSMHLEPRGDLPAPPARFVWTRDPGAARYRVEVYGENGQPLGVQVTTDTSLALAALTLKPHDAATWRAVPIDASGRDRPAADFARYRVQPR
jgi:hypothetical protein